MHNRRAVLRAGAVGAFGGLAGCVGCGSPMENYRLTLDLHTIRPVDSGWEVVVSAVFEIEDASEESDGIGPFEISLYDGDHSVLATSEVESLMWADVPDDQRTEDECSGRGSTSVTRTFTVETVPKFIGPRFELPNDAQALQTGISSPFESLTAIKHSEAPGEPDSASTDQTTTAPTQTQTTTEAVRSTDYEQVTVERLPWPEPDNQAIADLEGLGTLEMLTDIHCTDDRTGSDVTTGGGELLVSWARPIPSESCLRPYLSESTLEDDQLTFVIGLHEPPHVICRKCETIGYTIRAQVGDDEDLPFEQVELVHTDEAGDVIERIRATADGYR